MTTTVAVDPETAFEVFTAEVGAWWKDGPRFRVDPSRPSTMRFEPGVGGRLLEDYGDGDTYSHGNVQVWEPGRRLVFQMAGRRVEPQQRTEVEVRFEPVAGGTRVTLEHRGWDRLPHDHPARHGLEGAAWRALMGTWWADLLVAWGAHAVGRRRGLLAEPSPGSD